MIQPPLYMFEIVTQEEKIKQTDHRFGPWVIKSCQGGGGKKKKKKKEFHVPSGENSDKGIAFVAEMDSRLKAAGNHRVLPYPGCWNPGGNEGAPAGGPNPGGANPGGAAACGTKGG